jgi:hypothetical protein
VPGSLVRAPVGIVGGWHADVHGRRGRATTEPAPFARCETEKMSEIAPTGFVGVYHADGGPIGELRYLVGHMLGTAHCGLCDVTHSWRRKPEWDAMVARLGIPFELVHLNEMDAATADAVRLSGSPAVFARTETGLRPVLDADDLDRLDGSVSAFEHELCLKVPALRPRSA